jgi:SAM-dependent methyltransferase
MTRMLEALDVRDGHRVLEIGTGTGYNAGLLSHRLRDTDVFSIDIEPDLVDLARQRLARLGYHPTVVAAEGAEGLPHHAPFALVRLIRHTDRAEGRFDPTYAGFMGLRHHRASHAPVRRRPTRNRSLEPEHRTCRARRAL